MPSIAYLFATGFRAGRQCGLLGALYSPWEVQLLCVACDGSFANSLPLGLGRYPFPVFFRTYIPDLFAGFDQDGKACALSVLASTS